MAKVLILSAMDTASLFFVLILPFSEVGRPIAVLVCTKTASQTGLHAGIAFRLNYRQRRDTVTVQ